MDKEEIYCNKCLNVYFNTFNECPFCEKEYNEELTEVDYYDGDESDRFAQ